VARAGGSPESLEGSVGAAAVILVDESAQRLALSLRNQQPTVDFDDGCPGVSIALGDRSTKQLEPRRAVARVAVHKARFLGPGLTTQDVDGCCREIEFGPRSLEDLENALARHTANLRNAVLPGCDSCVATYNGAATMCEDQSVAGEDTDGRAFNRAMVRSLRAAGYVRSARVAAAMEAVPREVFVPGLPLAEVYRPSEAIVTKRVDGVTVSSASAPEVIAVMLEQLDTRPGDRVLEIGAGTGYNAALLAHLVGETGHVVTLDIDADLVQGAREHLSTAGYDRVEVVQTDGALGYREDGVYDRIILTVSSSDIAPAWREQLAPDRGRLVLPLGLRGPQRSVAFASAGDHLASDSVRNCSFIPLRGVLAPGTLRIALDPEGGRVLTGVDEPPPVAAEAIAALLRAPARSRPSGVSTNFQELRDGLHLWLVTHLRGICTLWGGKQVPDLLGSADGTDVHGTLCALDAKRQTLVLLAWANAAAHAGEIVIQMPIGADEVAERVRDSLHAWQAAGRPMDGDLQIRAYPRAAGPSPTADEVILDQRWSRFVLSWSRRYPPATLTV